MSWKQDINKFQSPHSKILYMIYHFSKAEEISNEQKTKLKEYVILEDEKIFDILNEFEQNFDEEQLLEEMKKLYDEELKFSFQENNITINDEENRHIYSTNKSSSDNIIGLKPIPVNTEHSFLNNAMNYIKKRGSEHEGVQEASNQNRSDGNIVELNSPMGNTLLIRKKKQQLKKKKENSMSEIRLEKSEKKINNKKQEVYLKSFLGRAVGNLGEEEK